MLGQFSRYAVIGLVLNAALYGLYLALAAAGLSPVGAMTASYALGIALGFVMNRRITFGHNGRPAGPFFRYIVAYALGYLLNWAGLWLLVDRMAVPHQLAQAGLICAVACFLFIMQRIWVFAAPRAGHARNTEPMA